MGLEVQGQLHVRYVALSRQPPELAGPLQERLCEGRLPRPSWRRAFSQRQQEVIRAAVFTHGGGPSNGACWRSRNG